jgi:nitrite reductase/ring-hydroxylating ferredoxin subunit
MNRRDALKRAFLSGVGLFVLDEFLVGRRAAASPASTLELSLTDSRFAALRQINGTVEITDSLVPGIQNLLPSHYPLALVRVSDTVVSAVSKECSHQQCQVNKYNGTRFNCPCHGSVFSGTGERVSGPAPGPLPTYPTVLTGDLLTISGLPGSSAWNLTEAMDASAPTAFRLLSTVPNPFSGVTDVRYALAVAVHVRIAVVDAAGRTVALLVDERQNPGERSVRFDAGTLPSGTYFAVLRAGSYTESKRMALVR